MPNAFGLRLAAAMKASGMRASDLARLCAVRPQAVGKWLKMNEARLAAVHAFCAADAMNVDVRRLVTGFVRQKKVSK